MLCKLWYTHWISLNFPPCIHCRKCLTVACKTPAPFQPLDHIAAHTDPYTSIGIYRAEHTISPSHPTKVNVVYENIPVPTHYYCVIQFDFFFTHDTILNYRRVFGNQVRRIYKIDYYVSIYIHWSSSRALHRMIHNFLRSWAL